MVFLHKHKKNSHALHKMSLVKIVARLPERAKFCNMDTFTTYLVDDYDV